MVTLVTEGQMFVRNSDGKECVITYTDNGKCDLLFSNRFLMRDIDQDVVIRDYELKTDYGNVLNAIEELIDDTD